MGTHEYKIQMEIAGPTAIWTRPDTGDSPGTYPVPTRSAAKGIFESILWNPAIRVVPSRVEICAPIIHHSYATNYGGPLRTSEQIRGGNNYQLFATVLINVRYRLYADLHLAPPTDLSHKIQQWLTRTRSPCHAFRDIFERRIRAGRCHHIPSLGWREFVPSYVGAPSGAPIQTDINMTLPTMPDWIRGRPAYAQGLVIKNGVMHYGPIIC